LRLSQHEYSTAQYCLLCSIGSEPFFARLTNNLTFAASKEKVAGNVKLPTPKKANHA
jgi:hypothetical protein